MQKRNNKKTNVTILSTQDNCNVFNMVGQTPGSAGKFPVDSDLPFLSTFVLDQTMRVVTTNNENTNRNV